MIVDGKLLDNARKYLAGRIESGPVLGIVAGSGLGGLSGSLSGATTIPYGSIPGFPPPTVRGHEGMLVTGSLSGVSTAFMSGRIHYYEGREMPEVVFPVALLKELGAGTLVVLSAAGAIAGDLGPGSVMVVEDHINLMGANPLRFGPCGVRTDDIFVDMTGAYDRVLGKLALGCAEDAGIPCRGGVIAAVSGPSYETPAEVRMLGGLGADAVCMSMVPEVIAARYLGMRVLGIAVVTNRAAGLSVAGPNHDEVLAASSEIIGKLSKVLSEVSSRL